MKRPRNQINLHISARLRYLVTTAAASFLIAIPSKAKDPEQGAINAAAPTPPPVVLTDDETANRSLVYDSLGRASFANSEIDFAMTPPSGWQQRKHLPGRSAVFEAPEFNGYRATLAMQLAFGARYFDSVGIDEISEEIIQKVSRQGGTIPDFKVTDSQLIKTAEGRDAVLVYTTFTVDEARLMQAHLVLANNLGHVVVSFTDLASNFNFDDTKTPFHSAWLSMMSASLSGPYPQRFANITRFAIYGAIGLAVVLVALALRRRKETAADEDSLQAKAIPFQPEARKIPPATEQLDREFTGKEPIKISDVMSKEDAESIADSMFSEDLDDTNPKLKAN